MDFLLFERVGYSTFHTLQSFKWRGKQYYPGNIIEMAVIQDLKAFDQDIEKTDLSTEEIEKRDAYLKMRDSYIETGNKIEEAQNSILIGIGLLSEIKREIMRDWGI